MPVGESETLILTDTTALVPGSDFGPRYRIEALLGQGGWAASTKHWTKTLTALLP